MKNFKCPNCGAKINRNTLKCEYCGSEYTQESLLKPNSNVSLNTIRKLSPKQVISSIEMIDSSTKFQFIPVIFLCIWISICWIMGFVAVKTGGGLICIVPFAMSIFGITILITIIVQIKNENLKDIIKNLQKNNFQKAYDTAKQKGKKSQKVNLVAMLIAYHLFDDDEYVQQNAPRISLATLNSVSKINNDFANVVNLYK